MKLFKKNKDDEYKTASQKLNQTAVTHLAAERIIFEELKNDDIVARELIESLKQRNPLVINFSELSLTDANKYIAFFTGACIALDGNIYKIKETIYLFALKIDFLDGSLEQFIQEL